MDQWLPTVDGRLTVNDQEMVVESLRRIEKKLDNHIEEAANDRERLAAVEAQPRVAVLESTVNAHSKFFWAVGGVVVSLLVETGVGLVFFAASYLG